MATVPTMALEQMVISVHVHLTLRAIDASSIAEFASQTFAGIMVTNFLLSVQTKPSMFFVGQCNETENRTFVCICKPGWHGTYCQKMINHCEKTRCMNNGVCRPLLGGYKCECLYGYSDNHCNTTATKIVVYKIVSKSLAYIAVIAMISAAMFIIIMDILKYGFGIDVTHAELEKIRRKKQAKIRRRIIQRFVYVNPLPQPSSEQQVLAVTERKSREH